MKEWKGHVKGIDLGGWLSQCVHTVEHYESFIKEEDLARIASWGLDHVRVPVDFDLVEDKEGNPREGGYEYIQRAIDWTRKNGLNMVLDLHKTAGFSFDDGEQEFGFFENKDYQERFYKLWEKFANKYAKYADTVSFELLNEVTDQSFCNEWNRIATECIARIRKISKDVKILVGGYWNNSVSSVKDINVPIDENIVFNFHCYDPLVFTHQGAGWVKEMPHDFKMDIDLTYGEFEKKRAEVFGADRPDFFGFDPDKKFGPDYFYSKFEEAIKVAEEKNVMLYCGEYGVIETVDPEKIIKWYSMVNEVFRKYNIGRAAWSYKKMDFGLGDANMDAYRERLLQVM